MAKMPIVGTKSIEYVEEATFGTIPDNPTLRWLGLVNPFSPAIKKTFEEIRYLGDAEDTNTLVNMRNLQVGGELSAPFTYKPQDWDFVEFVTGVPDGLSDTIKSISMVQGIEVSDVMNYTTYKGAVCPKWSLSLPKFGIATVDVDMLVGDVADPTTTDPAGTGSHAGEATGDPFLWSDITDMRMDANDPPTTEIAHNVGDLKLEITNDIELPKDVDSTMWTKAAGHVVKNRSISLSAEMTWTDLTFYDLVKNSTKQNFRFTLGERIFMVKGLIWPEWNPEISPDDFFGEEVTAITDQPDLVIARFMGGAVADDGTVLTTETTGANNNTVNDMTLLPATPAEDDAYYFGESEKFSTLELNIGTAGVGTWTITWEYWDGTAWTTCVGISDLTTGFTAAAGWHKVTHTQQADWAKTTVNSIEAFWIRGRVSAYTAVTTQPKGTQSWVYDLTIARDMLGAVADDGTVFTGETSAANNVTVTDMTLLPATPAVNDAYYFGYSETFDTLQLNIGTAGVGTWTITWEYYNGSTWVACVGISDGSTGFTVAGWQTITHTVQTDWAATTIDSIVAYWIRGRVSAYTDITTQPKGTQSWVYE